MHLLHVFMLFDRSGLSREIQEFLILIWNSFNQLNNVRIGERMKKSYCARIQSEIILSDFESKNIFSIDFSPFSHFKSKELFVFRLHDSIKPLQVRRWITCKKIPFSVIDCIVFFNYYFKTSTFPFFGKYLFGFTLCAHLLWVPV